MDLYLQDNGQAAGPYPLEQIKELIANGTITLEMLAADNAAGPWRPLRDWPAVTAPAAAPSASGLPAPAPAAAPSAGVNTEQVKLALNDAWTALKAVAGNPTGGLETAFNALGEKRSLGAGIGLGVAGALCVAFSAKHIMGRVIGNEMMQLAAAFGGQSQNSGPGFGEYVKIFVIALVPCVALTVLLLAARKMFRGAGHAIGGDALVAGAAILPLGVVVLLSSLLANGEGGTGLLLIVLGVTALCLTVQMLHVGAVRVGKLSERVVVWSVPVFLMAAIVATYIVFGMFYGK